MSTHISQYIEIDLSDVDTDDLIEALSIQSLHSTDIEAICNLLKDEDSAKLNLFFKVKDRFTIQELEALFKEDLTTPISKEQLALQL